MKTITLLNRYLKELENNYEISPSKENKETQDNYAKMLSEKRMHNQNKMKRGNEIQINELLKMKGDRKNLSVNRNKSRIFLNS